MVVSAFGLVSCIRNHFLDIFYSYVERSAVLANHVFLDHQAAEVICPVIKTQLSNVLPLSDPGNLEIIDIVQHQT